MLACLKSTVGDVLGTVDLLGWKDGCNDGRLDSCGVGFEEGFEDDDGVLDGRLSSVGTIERLG